MTHSRRGGAACGVGYTLTECLVTLALLVSASAAVAPVTMALIDEARARQAAGFVAAQFRLARHRAAARGATEAIVFDENGGRWSLRTCRDANDNGVRRSELGVVDLCSGEPYELTELFPQVRIRRDPSIPDPAGGAGTVDPVRFGQSDMASFTPGGTATAGTVYLQSAAAVQYAVRVAGVNGRTRLLRYDPVQARWEEL